MHHELDGSSSVMRFNAVSGTLRQIMRKERGKKSVVSLIN